MPVWEPEIVVDEPLACRLLERFAELALESLEPLSHGWDYTIWLVDGSYAFRFPRRQIVVPGTEREIAILPRLAPLLPLPVPAPVFVGRPTDEYPWPFFGSRFLPGRELSEAALDEDARPAIALQLASFLRSLHAVELKESLPLDVNHRADMERRVPLVREGLADLERLGIWRAPPSVHSLLAQAERLPAADPTAVVHGDLHFRQVLVADRQVTGIVDWVDVCRSDPAIDLSMVWSFLPESQRGAFLEAYGEVSDEQLLRARVLALSLSAALGSQAHSEGLAAIEREALAGLDRATR